MKKNTIHWPWKQLVPGQYYELAGKTLFLFAVGQNVFGPDGEAVGWTWKLRFYDARRFRIRNSDGHIVRCPDSWLELHEDGTLVEVRRTQSTVWHLKEASPEAVGPQEQVYEHGDQELDGRDDPTTEGRMMIARGKAQPWTKEATD